MANQTLKTRINLKIDTLTNWNNSKLVLGKGEVAIATASSSAGTGLTEPVCMIKIGDGDHTFSGLDWNFHAKAADVLTACKTKDGLTTFIQDVIANSGIASDDAMKALADRVTATETSISTLNGAAETEGSIAHSIKAAIDALNLGGTYATKTEVATAEANAKSYADESKASLEQLNKKANAVGGYPVLEEVQGEEYPKIPSIYINQIDIKEYKKISSESELNTIEAQKGDVAILLEPELRADENGILVPTGETVITKSWLLYDVQGGNREWIKYGLSYATNAGYATYANNAGNASKINGMTINKLSQSAFNNLEDKNGIYFVVIGE
jgi:hypothetical protein